jgi:hypothetical protein
MGIYSGVGFCRDEAWDGDSVRGRMTPFLMQAASGLFLRAVSSFQAPAALLPQKLSG